MRRPYAGHSASLAAPIVLLACGSDPGRSILPPDGYPDAVAMAACAPWDGVATAIYLTPSPVELRTTPGEEVPRPHIRISLYRAREDLAGERIEIDQDDAGAAARCGTDGACQSAYRGWVRIRPLVEDSALVGDVHLEFVTGAPLDGMFDARWHETRRICG